MILSGELKDFSLADVLQLLLQQRKSGVLNLDRPKEKAELFISQGNITGVRVNGDTPESKVKEMLIESGRIGRKELAELEGISKDMDRSLLATLTAKGFIGEDDRQEWIQIISEDMVCELFSWVSGQYEFGTGLKGQPGSLANLNISTEFACMEGMRRIDEWPRLREALPDEKAVYRRTTTPFGGDKLGWDNLVLELVDGRKSLQQIGKQVPFGSFRLHECMVNLWDGGFVLPAEDTRQELEPAAAADPESERDRKTAMVLGLFVLVFLSASAVRLLALWVLGFGTPGTTDYEARIGHALAKENLETFLVDYAARKDNFPISLSTLAKEGVFESGEMKDAPGSKPRYVKINQKDFTLK